MATIQEINSTIMFGDLSNDQLDSVIAAIKYRRAQLTKANKRQLSIGSNVKWHSSKRGVTTMGRVEKIAIKYIIVRDRGNLLWRVPANMLELV